LSIRWISVLLVANGSSFLPKLYVYKSKFILFLSGSVRLLDASTIEKDFASNVSSYCPEGDINAVVILVA